MSVIISRHFFFRNLICLLASYKNTVEGKITSCLDWGSALLIDEVLCRADSLEFLCHKVISSNNIIMVGI